MSANKDRLDKLIVMRGLTVSRDRARALIMSGSVYVNAKKVTKAGELVDVLATIELKASDIPFVSRGGLKLQAALDEFRIELTDKICMDIGASTGGFTDCMLKKGAHKVYAIDVGYGQLDYRLRNDQRVINIEKTNFRYIQRSLIGDVIDFVAIDVSFISVLKILPKVTEFIHDSSQIVCLIKPQFESAKGEVGKGGVIRDDAKRRQILQRTTEGIDALGYKVLDIIESPIAGQKGNIEFLALLSKR